jgi:PleD family two-component response regulator
LGASIPPHDAGSKEKHLAAAVTPPFGMLLAQATAKKLTNRWPQMYSILLVDDESQLLAAWSLILVNEGYRVTCASNGIEAVDLHGILTHPAQ